MFLLGKSHLISEQREYAGIEILLEIGVDGVIILEVRTELREILDKAGEMYRRCRCDNGIVVVEHQTLILHFLNPKM